MNNCFTASARAAKEEKENHKLIFEAIKKLGHNHLDNYKKDHDPKKFYSSENNIIKSIYTGALNFIKTADLVILEVSTYSLTMGYLIKHAIDVHTPVITLYTKNHSPWFIIGIDSDNSTY